MRMRTALFALVCLSAFAAGASERERVEDDGYRPRLSLPTETDRAAWAQPGLRVQLGYGWGSWSGAAKAQAFTTHAFTVRPVVRLDERWSLAASFSYAAAAQDYPVGLRWSAAAETMFHPLPQLGLSLGVGYGGLMVSGWSAAGDADGRFACEGNALTGLARAEYLFVAGPLFATGPYLQMDGQYTRCPADVQVDPETGRKPPLAAWWANAGGGFGWWLAWR